MLGQIRLQAQHLLLHLCKCLASVMDRSMIAHLIATTSSLLTKPSTPTCLNDGEQQVLLPTLHGVDTTDQLLVLLVVGTSRVFLQVPLVHHARHLTRVNERARPVMCEKCKCDSWCEIVLKPYEYG